MHKSIPFESLYSNLWDVLVNLYYWSDLDIEQQNNFLKTKFANCNFLSFFFFLNPPAS